MSAVPEMEIVVAVRCAHCKGERRVPGGQRKYGELVDCPVCEGLGRVRSYVSIERLAELLAGAKGGANA